MIIHKLILRHLGHKDDSDFYLLQARDALKWIEQSGSSVGSKTRALDLGCGHGVFGRELVRKGCQTVFADEENFLFPEISEAPFRKVNIDVDDITALGQYDLVICSNVLEHLSKPDQFLASAHTLLTPSGKLYLSWTNWYSPWGGHEFSPFHYLGARRGHLIYDKIIGRPRKHTPFVDLFPTMIGGVMKSIRQNPNLRILRVAPRYYTEFSFLMKVPVVREFVAWNCAMLIEKKG